MNKPTDKRWQVTIEDAGNDEVIIPLPDDLLEQLGWKIGDEVIVDSIKPGELTLAKATATHKEDNTHDN